MANAVSNDGFSTPHSTIPVQQPSPKPASSVEERSSVSSSPAKQSFPPLNEEQNLKGVKRLSRVSVNLVSEHPLHVLLLLNKLITFVLSFLSVVSNYIYLYINNNKKSWKQNFTVEPKHVELYRFR